MDGGLCSACVPQPLWWCFLVVVFPGSALSTCPLQGIANRDIKLENTLLNSTYENALRTSQRFPLMKLCDFGYSKVRMSYWCMSYWGIRVHGLHGLRSVSTMHGQCSTPSTKDLAHSHHLTSPLSGMAQDEHEQSMPKSRVGTMDYIAPEVVLNMRGEQYDGKKADIWALGVMLYAMVTLKYPFRRPEDEAVAPDMQGPAVLKVCVVVVALLLSLFTVLGFSISSSTWVAFASAAAIGLLS